MSYKNYTKAFNSVIESLTENMSKNPNDYVDKIKQIYKDGADSGDLAKVMNPRLSSLLTEDQHALLNKALEKDALVQQRLARQETKKHINFITDNSSDLKHYRDSLNYNVKATTHNNNYELANTIKNKSMHKFESRYERVSNLISAYNNKAINEKDPKLRAKYEAKVKKYQGQIHSYHEEKEFLKSLPKEPVSVRDVSHYSDRIKEKTINKKQQYATRLDYSKPKAIAPIEKSLHQSVLGNEKLANLGKEYNTILNTAAEQIKGDPEILNNLFGSSTLNDLKITHRSGHDNSPLNPKELINSYLKNQDPVIEFLAATDYSGKGLSLRDSDFIDNLKFFNEAGITLTPEQGREISKMYGISGEDLLYNNTIGHNYNPYRFGGDAVAAEEALKADYEVLKNNGIITDSYDDILDLHSTEFANRLPDYEAYLQDKESRKQLVNQYELEEQQRKELQEAYNNVFNEENMNAAYNNTNASTVEQPVVEQPAVETVITEPVIEPETPKVESNVINEQPSTSDQDLDEIIRQKNEEWKKQFDAKQEAELQQNLKNIESQYNDEHEKIQNMSSKELDEYLGINSSTEEVAATTSSDNNPTNPKAQTKNKKKQKGDKKPPTQAEIEEIEFYAKHKNGILHSNQYRKEYSRLLKEGKSEVEALKIIREYQDEVSSIYENMSFKDAFYERRQARKGIGNTAEERLAKARLSAGNYVPKKQKKRIAKKEIIESNTLASATKGGKGLGNAIISGGMALVDFRDGLKDGKTPLEAGASAAFEFAKGEVLGWKGMLALGAVKLIPKAAVGGYTQVQTLNRSMNNLQRFTPFADAEFADTQQLATMRQSGMEMAKMANYNLQQTLMGTEAKYLHQ